MQVYGYFVILSSVNKRRKVVENAKFRGASSKRDD